MELSVNDYGYLYGRSDEPIERFTRRILSLPSNPFIIYVTLIDLIEKVKWWDGRLPNPRRLNLEDLGQHDIARYYHITIRSWRDVVCPMDSEGSKRRIEIKRNMISDDHFHIGVKIHVQIALMLTRYAQKVFRSIFKPMKSKLRRIEAIDNITPLFMKNQCSQSLLLVTHNYKLDKTRIYPVSQYNSVQTKRKVRGP